MGTKTIGEVSKAAVYVTDYIQQNNKTPTKVSVGGLTVSRATFNRMMAAAVVEIFNDTKLNILTTNVSSPPAPTGGLPNGRIDKKPYVDICLRTRNFIKQHGVMPNYINTSLGKMSPYNFMDMIGRVLNFYYDEKYLPNYVNVNSLSIVGSTVPTSSIVPSNLKPYLAVTKNCQVTNSSIKKLGASLTKSTPLATAKSIFTYVRDKADYLFYYNTRYGAVGTLSRLGGNCCDLSHLQNALFRACNIPARYIHVRSKFSSGIYGHIASQAYLSGGWHNADASNNGNEWDKIGGEVQSVYAYYKELPF